MTTIKINGKEYNIAYNMQVACLYERVTGRNPLNVNEEFSGNLENTLRLGYCMVISNNDQQTTPDLDEILKTLRADEIQPFMSATHNEMNAYFKPLIGDKQEEADNNSEEEDDSPNHQQPSDSMKS